METNFDYTDGMDYAEFSSDERKWINKIYKLQAEYPNEVTIIANPETNDGCILAYLPKTWLKIRPPIKRDYTEEQRMALANRLAECKTKRILQENGAETLSDDENE